MPFLSPNQQRQSTEGSCVNFATVSRDGFCGNADRETYGAIAAIFIEGTRIKHNVLYEYYGG